jgi:hypothetical protein
LYFFESIQGARFYLKNTTKVLEHIRSRKKVLATLQEQGPFAFCSFPTKNINFLKTASNLHIPLWDFLNNINSLSCTWKEGVFTGEIDF